MSEAPHYDRRTILFHWLTAGLIAIMWLIPQFIDDFTGNSRIYVRSSHILLGLVLLAVVAARLVWRTTSGKTLPPADDGWMDTAAKATHHGLYALTIAVLLLGVLFEAIRADNILTLGRLPSIAPGNKDLRNTVGDLHALAANAILILAGLHAAAALFHQFVMKDNLLRRMWRGV